MATLVSTLLFLFTLWNGPLGVYIHTHVWGNQIAYDGVRIAATLAMVVAMAVLSASLKTPARRTERM